MLVIGFVLTLIMFFEKDFMEIMKSKSRLEKFVSNERLLFFGVLLVLFVVLAPCVVVAIMIG